MSTILLVTADKELSRVVKLALHDTPAKVTMECATGRLAVEHFSQMVPSMVILDLFVPETSGLEVLKSLKKINEACLYVLLTRMRTRNILERAFRQGAQDVLMYPMSTDVLRETILHRLEAEPMAETNVDQEQPEKPTRKK